MQRVLSRGAQVTFAVLEVDGERLGGFARNLRWAAAEIQRLPPGDGSILVLPLAAAEDRIRPQCLGANLVTTAIVGAAVVGAAVVGAGFSLMPIGNSLV